MTLVHSKARSRKRVGVPAKWKRSVIESSKIKDVSGSDVVENQSEVAGDYWSIKAEKFEPNWVDVKVEGSVCPLGRGKCDFVSSCDDVLGLGHNCSRVR